MGFTVTSSGRRAAMLLMLGLAVAGAALRTMAPNPSTLRDVGSLLLVLWLPAVGNLIAYLVRKIPRRPPPVTDFPVGSVFAPQLRVGVETWDAAAAVLRAIDPAERRCTLIVGRRGFTGRLALPVAQALAPGGQQTLDLELLHPANALPQLSPGTDFHLLVGTTAVAKGRVADAVAP